MTDAGTMKALADRNAPDDHGKGNRPLVLGPTKLQGPAIDQCLGGDRREATDLQAGCPTPHTRSTIHNIMKTTTIHHLEEYTPQDNHSQVVILKRTLASIGASAPSPGEF